VRPSTRLCAAHFFARRFQQTPTNCEKRCSSTTCTGTLPRDNDASRTSPIGLLCAGSAGCVKRYAARALRETCFEYWGVDTFEIVRRRWSAARPKSTPADGATSDGEPLAKVETECGTWLAKFVRCAYGKIE